MDVPEGLKSALNFGFYDSIFSRRSRRFGLGMEIAEGTLKHKSRHKPVALSELEEAMLIWAGTGMTGLSLGDLPRTGISWLFHWTGRSWPCSCNSHSTELFYTKLLCRDQSINWRRFRVQFILRVISRQVQGGIVAQV